MNLGDPVDLWAGLEPRFLSAGYPWRRPPGVPLRAEPPFVPTDPVTWDTPCLSLHTCVADLLSHIFDYVVSPMVGLDGSLCLTAGALMAGNPLAALESRLEMDLTTRPAAAYLLARLTGRRGTQYFTPEWLGLNRKIKIMQWLTPEGLHAQVRLRLQRRRHERDEFHGDCTARQAARYLEYFQDFGTHLIRSLTYGEQLFQVFEVGDDMLPGLRHAFERESEHNRVCGPVAFGMAGFTRRPWTARASAILSASDSPDARKVAEHAIWRSGEPDGRPSLLSPGATAECSRTAVLDTLAARDFVAVSFACQALYIEDHRADAWSRIMRAGLNQRFPAARPSGWRAREQLSIATFVESAGLVGEEALCKAAAPVLPEIAFALDLTGSAGIATPVADCLALFADTDPATGDAAEHRIDCLDFDPGRLTLPFLHGASCFTDAGGERLCLVEGVWLGRSDGGRPGIKADPAAIVGAVLSRHARQLAAYLRLMAGIRGAGFPTGADGAMRRCAAWLAEVTDGCNGLAELRWQALLVMRGACRMPPIVLHRAQKDGLVHLLRSCLAMLALHPASRELGAAAHRVERQLHAFYGELVDVSDVTRLDRRSLAAGESLQRCFAGLRDAPDLPPPAAAIVSAGAVLCRPPDLSQLPDGISSGDTAVAAAWNALLNLRARYAECRSVIAAGLGRVTEALDLLEREVVDCGAARPNGREDVLTALDALSCIVPDISTVNREMLLTGMTELLALNRSARLLQRAQGIGPEGASGVGPQLRRLFLMLETVQLCRAACVPITALRSLAPTVLAAKIDEALFVIEERHLAGCVTF